MQEKYSPAEVEQAAQQHWTESNAFKTVENDPRFAKHPMLLETPKEDAEKNELDPVNLGKLRGWLAV